jgi:single-strand DNA-binding protein
MAGEITTTVTGNLTGAPELRFLDSGVAVVDFTVANNTRVADRENGGYKDGKASFVNCVAFRQFAENIAESLSTGDRVVVHGAFKQESWKKDGEKRSNWKLDVQSIGPDLRYARAVVSKASRSTSTPSGALADDPWGSAPAAAGSGESAGQVPF